MSIFKRITAIAVSVLFVSAYCVGFSFAPAYADSTTPASSNTQDLISADPAPETDELLGMQETNDIPANATVLEINDGKYDAVITDHGLYYYTDNPDDDNPQWKKGEVYTKPNPNGYVLRGKTSNTITFENGVDATLYLDNVEMTSNRRYSIPDSSRSQMSAEDIARHDNDPDSRDSAHPSCIKVSHANVTIKIKGTNTLTIDGHPGSRDFIIYYIGCAIEKNGMDGKLVLETVSGENDASLTATGRGAHEGALTAAMGDPDIGFANLEILSGEYTFDSGAHTPGVGANCDAYLSWEMGMTPDVQMAKNIVIKKAKVTAYGGDCCAGIGAGLGTPVEGVYISDGAQVTAVGGLLSPGIGSGGINTSGRPKSTNALDVQDIVISGGDTVVIAYGDQDSNHVNTPGIGCGSFDKPEEVNYEQNLTNVKATALQNYVDPKDGITKSYYGIVMLGDDPGNISVDEENFIGDYSFAGYLKSMADKEQPVRYVEIRFRHANEIKIAKVPDTDGFSDFYKKQLNENVINGSMEGAEFGVYTDAECRNPLKLGDVVVTIETDKNGMGSVPVPNGTYYVKETKAPTGYLVSSDIRMVEVADRGNSWKTVSGASSNATFKNAPMTLNVTFKDAVAHGGAQLGDVQKVPYGCSAVAPSNPTWDDNHAFTGWDKSFNYITEDTVVTATYRTTSSAAKSSSDTNANTATSDTKATASKTKASGSAKTGDTLPVLPVAVLSIISGIALFIARKRLSE